MSQTDLDNFKLDVQKSYLPALLDKNLNADPNTNLEIIQNVLTNAKRVNSPNTTGIFPDNLKNSQGESHYTEREIHV